MSSQKRKYVCVWTQDIIQQIALSTDVPGYTEGVLEIFLPDDKQLKEWTEEQVNEWISKSNRRMEAICKLLNDKNL